MVTGLPVVEEAPPCYAPKQLKACESDLYPYRRISRNLDGSSVPSFSDDGFTYMRDPAKLIGYLIPFPKPLLELPPSLHIPDLFLIYTPPPPPLSQRAEGENEGKSRQIQRKWQEKLRNAKDTSVERSRWKNVRSKATCRVNRALDATTSSNIEFLARVDACDAAGKAKRRNENGSKLRKTKEKWLARRKNSLQASRRNTPTPTTTVSASSSTPPPERRSASPTEEPRPQRLQQIILVYPPSLPGTPASIRAAFTDSIQRTKAQTRRRSTTLLSPLSLALDILLAPLAPFTPHRAARNAAKRLVPASDHKSEDQGGASSSSDDDALQLHFRCTPGLEALQKYLGGWCCDRRASLFEEVPDMPDETDVLEAIGWEPSRADRWDAELRDVREDLRRIFGKAAREWEGWCERFARDPEGALTGL